MADKVRTAQIELDFPGFAQEFLRRNPQYRAEYHRVMAGRGRSNPRNQEEMARRWGLSFPMLALSIGSRSASILGRRCMWFCRHSRRNHSVLFRPLRLRI
ncbi:transcriptional regulator domain-containing protein [Blastomonas aquatica]|uniref:transcriptional regulator domain-containing protein n=1 Tax=Blastomonas aquatica TaxID=1510276 RepID=UPI001E539A08|nr:DUF6499 domain-containing protein [Blastomonas aquatica]